MFLLGATSEVRRCFGRTSAADKPVIHLSRRGSGRTVTVVPRFSEICRITAVADAIVAMQNIIGISSNVTSFTGRLRSRSFSQKAPFHNVVGRSEAENLAEAFARRADCGGKRLAAWCGQIPAPAARQKLQGLGSSR